MLSYFHNTDSSKKVHLSFVDYEMCCLFIQVQRVIRRNITLTGLERRTVTYETCQVDVTICHMHTTLTCTILSLYFQRTYKAHFP